MFISFMKTQAISTLPLFPKISKDFQDAKSAHVRLVDIKPHSFDIFNNNEYYF